MDVGQKKEETLIKHPFWYFLQLNEAYIMCLTRLLVLFSYDFQHELVNNLNQWNKLKIKLLMKWGHTYCWCPLCWRWCPWCPERRSTACCSSACTFQGWLQVQSGKQLPWQQDQNICGIWMRSHRMSWIVFCHGCCCGVLALISPRQIHRCICSRSKTHIQKSIPTTTSSNLKIHRTYTEL